MPPAFDADAWPARKPDLTQGVAHGATAGTVTRGVDLGFGHTADIGPAAEETSKMSFLVAPRRDLDGAFDIGIGIEHAGGFQRIDDAKRPVEPARIVLAFEMGAGQQIRSGPCAGAEQIADAVDGGGEVGLRQPRGQPLQRAHVRLGEGRLVHAGLVGADRAQRMEVGQNAGAVGVGAIVRHGGNRLERSQGTSTPKVIAVN